jgi:small subunit ribosomal protein S3e
MKGYDPEGQTGPRKPLPDTVTIIEPPLDKIVSEPSSESRGAPAEAQIVPPAPPAAEEPAYPAEQFQQQDPFQAEQQPAF